MNKITSKRIKSGLLRYFLPCAAAGFIAGICNGLVGAGGGIVLVIAFRYLAKDDEDSARSAYANALLCMLPVSFLTLYKYFSSGKVSYSGLEGGLPILLGALAGGLLGAILLQKIKSEGIQKLFASLTVLSGVLMLLK